MFPCIKDGNRRSSDSEIPVLMWRVLPINESAISGDTNDKDGRYKVSGADSEERTNPRWAFGSLSGTYYRWSEVE